LARRIGALTVGLVLDKVLKADSRELAIELVRADGRLDISVT
jgi:hypothetical protein